MNLNKIPKDPQITKDKYLTSHTSSLMRNLNKDPLKKMENTKYCKSRQITKDSQFYFSIE
jgi:hypothetical protein